MKTLLPKIQSLTRLKISGRTKRRLIVLSCLVQLIAVESYLLYYTVTTFSQHCTVVPVNVSLTSQSYISPEEEGEIRVAIDNSILNDTDVAFRIMKGARLVQIQSDTGDSTIFEGQLVGQTQVSRNLKILAMWEKTILGKPEPAQLSLWGTANKEIGPHIRPSLERVIDLPISILTIPKARMLRNSLYAVVVIFGGWLLKLFWGAFGG